MAVWKSYTLHRFITGLTLFFLFAKIFLYYTTEAPMLKSFSTSLLARVNRLVSSDECVFEESRLWDAYWDSKLDTMAFYSLGIAHSIAIFSCIYIDILWLGIAVYKIMFLLLMFLTIGQGMIGYVENCLHIFALFCVGHVGMAICTFNLHVLFIYTHRGITFYQWIPLKIRELYHLLVDRNIHPKDHLMQKITGIQYKSGNNKSEKVPLLEEDQEEFNQLIEKTCVEG